MQNNALVLAAAALLALFSSSTFSQSGAEQAQCDLIRNAAEAGRARAVDRLGNMESLVKDQMANARSCLERFGDLASRQTVTVGGFDVAPIRDAIFKNACSVIQGKVSQVHNQVSQSYSQVTNLPQTALSSATRGMSSSVANAVTSQLPSAPATSSVWDRLTTLFSNP